MRQSVMALLFLSVAFSEGTVFAWETLPPGSIRPEGHLRTELERMRDGLTGHAEELYPDIGKSDWLTNAGIGGEHAWERGPYYARGLVALAFALNDADLKVRAKKWVDAVLASQRPDGDFGPRTNNWWANMLPLAYLRDWADATGDERVVPFLERYFAYQRETLRKHPLSADSFWAVARAGDEIESVLWLRKKTGSPEWVDFARELSEQASDWTTYYHHGGDPGVAHGYRAHIVNFMQGLKLPALRTQLFESPLDDSAYDAAFSPSNWVMRSYGRPDGMINGSEPLSDRSSTAGTELCAIVERIISSKTILALTEKPMVADDLEDVVYNALPATFGRDGKGLRYYCLLNQPSCENKGLLFANNGFGSQVTGAICPGPHSGFGCCRSNCHAAWPKFTESMWMRSGDGLALVLHGPSSVRAELPTGTIVFREETDYPYSGRATIRVIDGGGRFPLLVRVPRWAKVPDAGTFRRYERSWQKGDAIEIDFPMETEISFWDRQAVCVRRGPLLYALDVPSETIDVTDYDIPYENRKPGCEAQDFPRRELRCKGFWNYVLALTAEYHLLESEAVGEGVGQRILVKAWRTDAHGWGSMRADAPARAADPPWSPVAADDCYYPQTIALVPLAQTQTRVALLPWCVAGYWCYPTNDCAAWMLQTLRAEAAQGILHFGYPGKFLNLDSEPKPGFTSAKQTGATCIPGFAGRPPHLVSYPETQVHLSETNGLYDAGRVEIGFVRVSAKNRPCVFPGESMEEALSTDTNGFEQTIRMVEAGPDCWRSEIPLALRYFRFDCPVENVRFDTQVDWRPSPGDFICGDKRIEKIWRIGRDTLRRCRRTFFVDGLKRDRHPWAADLVTSMMAEAYTFGDPEPVKRHLEAVASADPGEGQVNGIISYSLWWVIGHDLFQRYFGDLDFLKLHYPKIRSRIEELVRHEDERGFLVRDLGWDFMDWTDSDSGELKSEITRQIIYYGALNAAVRMGRRLGDMEDVCAWERRAERLRHEILTIGMDQTRHARILAILFELVDKQAQRNYAREIVFGGFPPTVTPYFSAYEVMALAKAGEVAAAMKKFESVWGAMTDAGVDAFWEGWNGKEEGAARYRYYGRPFGKSLCHAWSTGPAFLIPGVFLGVRPASDGWKTYDVKPLIPSLTRQAVVTIPSPQGSLRVDLGR